MSTGDRYRDRLSPDEVESFSGYKHPSRQLRAFKKMGIRAERNGAGEVIVARAWLTEKVVGENEPKVALLVRQRPAASQA